ncbi:MAG: ATPase, T2SS/T4P/T4SS family, partial [Promethearchaeota archaeon]
MILKNVSYFQEKENLAGKKEFNLVIDCKKCTENDLNTLSSEKCLPCFLYHLYINKTRKFNRILISKNDISVNFPQFRIILNYFKNLNKIKKYIFKLRNIRKQKCKFTEFKCDIFQTISNLYDIQEYKYYNPIFVYNLFSIMRSEIKEIKISNSICQDCQKYVTNLLKTSIDIFEEFSVIKKSTIKENPDKVLSEILFSNPPQLQETTGRSLKLRLKDNKILIAYKIGKYKLFQVSLYHRYGENENLYQIKLNLKDGLRKEYLENIILDTLYKVDLVELDRILPIEELIDLYQNESLKILNQKYKFAKSIRERLGFVVALKKLHLYKIFPLLIDDFIEEIFLDSPNDIIYINHRIFGRCRTAISFKLKEIERIKTLIRLYSGKRLDYMNPSIKIVLKNKYFYCRFAIDVNPIQIHNFAFDIRKLNKNIFTIQDLLKNGTLNASMAAFLYFNLIRKRNLTITGETDTGKTTLINALDLLTPKEFRKIYVENVTESLNQLDFGKHQLKYRVDSLEDHKSINYSKGSIIKTLLHRSPDIIYLGEILTKEEAEAMFHCLAAGLKGFQTIHADSIEALLNRLLFHFEINKSCLSDLDLIIVMKKEFNKLFDPYYHKAKELSDSGQLKLVKEFTLEPWTGNGFEIKKGQVV